MAGTERPESAGPPNKETPSGRTASVSHLPSSRARSMAEFDPSDAFFPANLPDMAEGASRPGATKPVGIPPGAAPKPTFPAYVEAPRAWHEDNASKIVAVIAVALVATGAYFFYQPETGRPDAKPASTAPAATGQIQRPSAPPVAAPAQAPAPPPSAASSAASPSSAEPARSQASAAPPKATPPVATVAPAPRPSRSAQREAAPSAPAAGSGVTHTKGSAASASQLEPAPVPRDAPAATVPAATVPAAAAKAPPAQGNCTPALAALGLCTP